MQKIRIRDTDADLIIDDPVFPFLENGILYIRMIILNHAGERTEFLSVMPQDVLWRTQPYTDEMMDDLDMAANKAMEDFAVRVAKQEIEDEENEITETTDDQDGMHYG